MADWEAEAGSKGIRKADDWKGKSGEGAMLMAGPYRMWENNQMGLVLLLLPLCHEAAM